MKKLSVLTSILLTTGIAVLADPVTPAGTFGTLSDFTAGTGNPNNAFMTSTYTDTGGNTVTVGLQAQGRYSNPTPGNNGAGTYYATPGENYGDPANPTSTSLNTHLGATWGFDFYFNATGGSFTYKLFYGSDTTSPLYSIDPTQIGDNEGTANTGGQNIENLLFPNWGGSSVPNELYSSFDPNADGVYGFKLVAYEGDSPVATSAINVHVPDTGSTAMLLGLGFIGLAAFGFKQKRLQTAK